MKKLFSTSVLLFLLISIAFAQTGMEDVVYLKNGSVIRGSIISLVPDSAVKIEISGGSILVYQIKEVQSISKENTKTFLHEKQNFSEKIGIGFELNGGVISGSNSNDDKSPFSLHLQSFYMFKSLTTAGIGTGFDFFTTTLAPVYMDVRQYIVVKNYVPFVFVQGGYILPVDAEYKDFYTYKSKVKNGYMVNPGIGIVFPARYFAGITLSLSYRYQMLYYSIKDNYKPDYSQKQEMNRLNLRIGILFK